jgi:hypothetical protein
MYLRTYLPGGESLDRHEHATAYFVKIAQGLHSDGASLTRTAPTEHENDGAQRLEVRSSILSPGGDVLVDLAVDIDRGPNPHDRGMWSASATWRELPWPGGKLNARLTIADTMLTCTVAGAPPEEVVRVGEVMSNAMGVDFDPKQLLFHARHDAGPRGDPDLERFVEHMRERGLALSPRELGGLLAELARGRDESGIERLLQEGADPNGTSPWERPTWAPALHSAVNSLRLPIIERLLSAGADVDARDDLGRTPLMSVVLMWRSIEDRIAVVERLAEAGADLNARAKNGYTALIVAMRNGAKAIPLLRRLIELGADPSLVDEEGNDAVALAEAWKVDPEVVAVLRGAT